MPNTRWTVLLSALALLAAGGLADEVKPERTVGTRVGQMIPHFKADLWDLSGEEPSRTGFDSHGSDQPTAYVFVSGTCSWCHGYKSRLVDLAKTYGEKGIRFVMVYPMTKEPAGAKRGWHKKTGFAAPMVDDKDASIAKKLGVTRTPEVILVSKENEIVYRGGIDDSPGDAQRARKNYFKDACDDLLAGKKVRTTTAPLYG